MKRRFAFWHIALSGALVLVAACGSGPGRVESGTGGSGAGGSPTGGTSSGGTVGSGGTTGAGGVTGSGGAAVGGSGGSSATGGRSGAGGLTGSGGTSGQGGAAGKAGTGGAVGAAGTTHTGVWNVMMLGDSVTESTCYPQITYQHLKAANHTNFQFVGYETTEPVLWKRRAGARQGRRTRRLRRHLPAPEQHPRRLHARAPVAEATPSCRPGRPRSRTSFSCTSGPTTSGTGSSTSTILSAYVAVIAEFRKQNPNVIFFVSKIIKLRSERMRHLSDQCGGAGRRR